jgi:HEPN domain-containing protein
VQRKGKREWVRSQLIQARNELETAKHHRYFGCDVCGPYGHTFHVCHSTVAKSIKALLYYHDREPGEIYDLKRLVVLASAVAPGFESRMNTAIDLTRCGHLTETDFKYKPSDGEFKEAIQLAEELVAFVSAALPEDVR